MTEIADSVLPKLQQFQTIYHPSVKWSQEAKKLTLRIQLRGASSFSLRVTSKQLLFWTTYDNKRYAIMITFFDEINPSKSTNQNSGGCITVGLEKLKNEKWPRLTSDSQKLSYISQDVDDNDSSDEEVTFAKIRKNVPLKRSELDDHYMNGIPPELDTKYGYVDAEDDDADFEREPETDDSELDSEDGNEHDG